jgi:hypothetical protein
MWSLGSLTSNDGEGSSDDSPILLIQGILVACCSCFITSKFDHTHVLYYYSYSLGRSPGSAVSLSAVQWLSVLAIATKYDMEVIRQKSIEEVKRATPPLDPIDQIIAARRYNCQELAEGPIAGEKKGTSVI